jgi:hypothetical protein
VVRGLLVRIALWDCDILLLGSEIVNVDEGELEEELSDVNVDDFFDYIEIQCIGSSA